MYCVLWWNWVADDAALSHSGGNVHQICLTWYGGRILSSEVS